MKKKNKCEDCRKPDLLLRESRWGNVCEDCWYEHELKRLKNEEENSWKELVYNRPPKKLERRKMSDKPLITIGYQKGEIDFLVSMAVGELPLKELEEMRKMIVVAIWCAEDMWRRNQPNEATFTKKDEE